MILDVGARANGTISTANGRSNDVSIIEPATGHLLAHLGAGNLPWGLAIDPR